MTVATLSISPKGTITIPKKMRTQLGFNNRVIAKVNLLTNQLSIEPIFSNLEEFDSTLLPRHSKIPEEDFSKAVQEEISRKYLKNK
jgi:bifunctional DNA-binding transcriptional regulator/antitoxin component of YhaV-PrlF toxin-antitoxin module